MTSKQSSTLPPFAILALGILAVSTASIFIRYAQDDASSIVVSAYRMGLASVILAPFALPGALKSLKILTIRQRWLVGFSGIFLALHFATWITSLEYTSVASSVVLVTTTPLWVAILSPLVLKERMRREIWIGLFLAMAGGAVVGLQEACTMLGGQLTCLPLREFLGGRALIGNALALFGAFMASGYMLVGRQVRPAMPLLSYTFSVYSISAIILIILVIVSGQPAGNFPAVTYLWFLLLAVFPQIIGHSAFNWALKYLPAAFVSLALLGEPVGTTILAVIFLNEVPGPAEIFGGLMILTGIFLAYRAGLRTEVQD